MNGKKIGKIIIIIGVIFITWLLLKSNFSGNTGKNKSIYENYGVPFKRCISIGNSLEMPKDVHRSIEMKSEYFDIIKNAGFDCVRLPIRFSDYVNKDDYYTLDKEFMAKIDSYINYALNDNLSIIIDFHNFTEIMNEPEDNKECLLSVGSQLSQRYKDYPKQLIFELLNEPQNHLEGELWNEYLAEGISVIRENDKNRKIIIGPDRYNSVDRFYKLKIPRDNNLIVTFHYYEPCDFTFQNNEYPERYKNFKRVMWDGTDEELRALRNKFEIAQKWSKANKVGVFVGEFGIDKDVEESYRKRWIGAVRKQADECDFAWGYWELCSDFGTYNSETGQWDKSILSQLISN